VPELFAIELLSACCLAPLAFTDLRLPVSGDVAATDASEQGGGRCVSDGLTASGLAQVQKAKARKISGTEDEVL
jgi:hypothetical protein